MNLDVSQGYLLLEETIPFDTTVDLPPQDIMGEEIAFDPIAVNGTYTVATSDMVVVTGTLKTAANARCAMCLSPVSVPMELTFREVFKKNLEDDDEDTFTFEKKSLPLDDMVLTLLLLHLPMRFECAGGCADGMNLQAYVQNGDDVTHPEEGEQELHSYQPFAQLGEMLDKHENKDN